MSTNALIQVIDERFLRPTSRVLVQTILWLLARWEYTLATICFAVAGAYFLYEIFAPHRMFWDVYFYGSVVKAVAAGMSPYDNAYLLNELNVEGYEFGFVYPPFVATIFYELRWLFLTSAGLTILLIVHAISWLSIPFLLAGSPKDWYARNFLYVWGLFLILFGFAGTRLLVVGNIAALLLAVIIFSTVAAVRTKDYKLFWPAVLVCSFVKFYLLVFLLVPVILDKRYLSAGMIVCTVGGLYALNYFITPGLFSEYVSLIASGSSDARNAGMSIYSFVVEVIKLVLGPGHQRVSVIAALGIQFVFVISILSLAYSIFEKFPRPERFDLYCCWLFISAFLISPRISDYDLAVVSVPFVLLSRMLLMNRGPGLGVALVTAIFAFILLRASTTLKVDLLQWSPIFAVLGVWLGTAVHWIMSARDTGARVVESPS